MKTRLTYSASRGLTEVPPQVLRALMRTAEMIAPDAPPSLKGVGFFAQTQFVPSKLGMSPESQLISASVSEPRTLGGTLLSLLQSTLSMWLLLMAPAATVSATVARSATAAVSATPAV